MLVFGNNGNQDSVVTLDSIDAVGNHADGTGGNTYGGGVSVDLECASVVTNSTVLVTSVTLTNNSAGKCPPHSRNGHVSHTHTHTHTHRGSSSTHLGSQSAGYCPPYNHCHSHTVVTRHNFSEIPFPSSMIDTMALELFIHHSLYYLLYQCLGEVSHSSSPGKPPRGQAR